jgi:hypothetical protein
MCFVDGGALAKRTKFYRLTETLECKNKRWKKAMTRLNSMTSNDVAFVETVTAWWSREVEERVRDHEWNAYLVTFMFNHIPGSPASKLKLMQDSVSRFYSKLITRVVRQPNAIEQLFNRPRMMVAPDYPVFKHDKIGIEAATVNDGLHVHAILVVPLKSRLKEDVVSHVARKSRLYIKKPLHNIHFQPIENNTYGVTDYVMKSIKRGSCRWEDVLFLPKSPSELSSE